MGLEEVLKDVIAELVKRGLDCSGPAIKKSILDGSFSTFDDHAVISQMRNALKDCGADDEIFSRKLNSVLKRQAPKLVAASERIAPRTQESDYLNNVDQLKRGVAGWANEFGIPVDLWHLWKAKLNLSKIGSTISVGEADDDAFDEEKQQIVRILTTHQHDAVSKSKPLIEHDFALMKQLANVRLYSMRLYVHLPEDVEAPGELRHAITRKIKADLPHFPFSS